MASVDIIIPNYNYARFLPACVESVLAQDVRPLRILIIDNASTDDSVAVARGARRQRHQRSRSSAARRTRAACLVQ